MIVGIPGSASGKKLIRMPANPADKATIVSVYPKEIDEVKVTLSPGRFIIPAAEDNDFSLLVVGSSSWFKEMEESQPALEVPTSSVFMADSIIKDYCNGLHCCNMGDAMPGLFYVPGNYNKLNILGYVNPETGKTFQDLLGEARNRQKKFFSELVKDADVMWARTSGNPLSISNDARLAADKLGISKPWMQDFKAVANEPCKACGTFINPLYPICPHCKAIIDPIKAKELGIEFAK